MAYEHGGVKCAACLALVLACGAGAQVLPPRLEEWRKEIEAGGDSRILLARVNWDRQANTYSLPPDTPQREWFSQYLRDPEFAAQFQRVHAITASRREGDRFLFLIFLNRGLLNQWGEFEEALIAHELFHAWFIAQKYPVPRSQPGKAGCLSVATLDLVQHVVMRDELRKRGVDHAKYQRRKRDIVVEEGARLPAGTETDPCLRVSAVSEWVDMRLELGPDSEYEAMAERLFPGIGAIGVEFAGYLSTRDLRDRAVHREALAFVFYRLREFWDSGK